MDIESTRQCLTDGTEGLEQLPLEELKETFEHTVNMVPSISSKVAEIASLIGGAIAKIEENSTTIHAEAKRCLDTTSEKYGLLCAADPDDDPSSQVKALWRQFDEVHYRTSIVVGPKGQWGDPLHLVLSSRRMQGHLAALEAEMAAYEQFRNGILGDIDQAEAARNRTIEQANRLDEAL